MNGDDLPPDPHLRAALRHAPDAGLQAPPPLRAAVLAAAREAVAPRPRWWQRLWPSTPVGLGTSGAFASLLLAGLITLLWRGEPPPAAVVPTVVAPAAAPAPPAAVVVADAAAPPPPALKKTAEPRAQVVATAPPPPPPAAAVEEARAERAEQQKAATLAAAAESERRARQDDRLAAAPAPAPAPPPTAAFAPPPVAQRLAAAPLPQAVDAAWLQALEEAVAGGWQASEPPAASAGLRRLAAGAPRPAQLWLGERQVWWCDDGAAPACRSAPLEAEAVRALRERLSR